jgi:Ca-activated chloride channel family protein
MSDIRFENPWFLLALLLIPAVMTWRRRGARTPVLLVPYAAAWSASGSARIQNWRLAALYAAMALLAVAAARPQLSDERREVVSRGYDLMLAVDLSTSMLAEDYNGPAGAINRLEAIRPVIQAFVAGRPSDRIGMVVFAGHAYTLAPLTTSYSWLEKQIANLRIGLIEDGTAIGDGLGISLTNLEASRATQSGAGAFVVLLTDGANTSGTLTPPQATAIARHRRIPVYTIGTGRNGMVPFPVFNAAGQRVGTQQRPSSLDVEALRRMSAETGGHYFEADDARAVSSAFAAIDAAQKTEIQLKTYEIVTELFAWAALPALVLLLWAASGLMTARPKIHQAAP